MIETAEPVRHTFNPIGAARDLFRHRGPEVLLSGPAGTGKSRACLEKMHFMMMATPGARGLIVRKTATSLTNTALVTFDQWVAKEAMESGEVRFYGGNRHEAAAYVYANKSTINVGGMDKSTKIMSSEYDVVYVQEATELDENDWESITTRLRNGRISFQQLMADCNPGPPHHWLKKRCERGQTEMFNSRWKDNPILWDEDVQKWTKRGREYVKLLRSLTGVRRLRLADGIWAAAEGLVYDTWDPAVHVGKVMLEPPPEWPHFWSVDFGYTNPFVWQDWVMRPDGDLMLYQEIYRTQTLVEDHAAEIRKLQKKARSPDPEWIVCDHDAEGRATLERELGMSTIPAKKAVKEGIEAVASRMKLNPQGNPGIHICRDANRLPDQSLRDRGLPSSTLEEVAEYIWADNGKDEPVKKNDHGMDAMRYMIAQHDLVGRPSVRVFYT